MSPIKTFINCGSHPSVLYEVYALLYWYVDHFMGNWAAPILSSIFTIVLNLKLKSSTVCSYSLLPIKTGPSLSSFIQIAIPKIIGDNGISILRPYQKTI